LLLDREEDKNMSILENNVIDSVICSEDSDEVVLLITDHMDWSNIHEHLIMLQQKLNTYVQFVESGQLLENFPESKGKDVKILVVGNQDLVAEAKTFYDKANIFLLKNINSELLFSFEA
jgi:hypothetical protein